MKLTTWNVEHLGKLLTGPNPAGSPRLQAIVQEIDELAPDVLCLVEGPGDLPALRDWAASAQGLNGRYHVATIPGTDELLAQGNGNARAALQDLYAMRGTDVSGNQWVWFLVKDGLFQDSGAHMLDPVIWRDLTRQTTWTVHEWGEVKPRRHRHWRHPQTLVLQLDGVEVEVIGLHLKSKINRLSPFDDNGELSSKYVEGALKARAKLTTEAHDVRRYIDRRFEQEPDPRIFVVGDMNDGPGRGYFERTFLYFDLVSNLQGDVFFAQRFLNHALFDFDDGLRWSTNFRDRVEEWAREQPDAASLPAEPIDRTRLQLIDHILFTQSLVGPDARPRVESHAGVVEHTVHQRINAPLTRANETSDHVPVSVRVTY